MAPVAAAAELVRADRRPVAADNPFLAAQKPLSGQVVAALDGWRDWRDAMVEATFHAIYGSPVVQALLGLRASDAPPRARPGREPEEIAFVQQRIAELKARMGQGGLREAFVRAIIYVRLPELAADERGFAVLQQGARGACGRSVPRRLQGAGARPVPDARARRGAGGGDDPAAAARPWRSGRQGFGAARERGDGARAAGPGGGAAPSSDRRAIHGCCSLDGKRRWRDPAAATPADCRRPLSDADSQERIDTKTLVSLSEAGPQAIDTRRAIHRIGNLGCRSTAYPAGTGASASRKLTSRSWVSSQRPRPNEL